MRWESGDTFPQIRDRLRMEDLAAAARLWAAWIRGVESDDPDPDIDDLMLEHAPSLDTHDVLRATGDLMYHLAADWKGRESSPNIESALDLIAEAAARTSERPSHNEVTAFERLRRFLAGRGTKGSPPRRTGN